MPDRDQTLDVQIELLDQVLGILDYSVDAAILAIVLGVATTCLIVSKNGIIYWQEELDGP